jgi:hypothetical protein
LSFFTSNVRFTLPSRIYDESNELQLLNDNNILEKFKINIKMHPTLSYITLEIDDYNEVNLAFNKLLINILDSLSMQKYIYKTSILIKQNFKDFINLFEN